MTKREKERRLHVASLRRICFRANQAGDLKTAFNALQQIAAVEGLIEDTERVKELSRELVDALKEILELRKKLAETNSKGTGKKS